MAKVVNPESSENIEKIPMNPSDPSLAELTVKEMSKVFGASGTRINSGYFDVDRVFDWNDPYTRARLVNIMRREFVAVSSALGKLKSPILGANWFVSGGEEEHREFIEKNLFDLSQRTWQELLIEIATFLDFGYAIFETIYEFRDGQIWLKDLAPRIQESIERFETMDSKAGVTQNLFGTNYNENQVSIPMSKLLIFTHNKEGDNLMGNSILRGARMHTVYLDRAYKVQGIAIERFGAGIPVVTFPTTGGDEEKQEASDLGESLKVNEQGYIAKQEGWEVEILSPSGSGVDSLIEKGIDHHTRQIFMACLAHGLMTGANGKGSHALSQTQDKDLNEFAKQKCAYVADQFNKYIIKKLIDLNFGVQEYYPELSFEIDMGETTDQVLGRVKGLVDMGVLQVQRPDENSYIRKSLQAPDLSEERWLEMEDELLQQEDDLLEAELGEEDEPLDEAPELDESDDEDLEDSLEDEDELNL